MLASYLISAGLSYEQAQTINGTNPKVELRAAQIAFLQELAAKYN